MEIIENFDSEKSGFTKCTYKTLDNPVPILIHYLGNNKNYLDHEPHGNTKDKGLENFNFKRSKPSEVAKLKESLKNKEAHMVYKDQAKIARTISVKTILILCRT